MRPWYTLDRTSQWIDVIERGLGEHAEWLTHHLNLAFEKGRQIERGNGNEWVPASQVNKPGWWFWFSDPESTIDPVSVLYSPTSGKYFATEGQLGWNRSQDVIEMGGLWMPCVPPPPPAE